MNFKNKKILVVGLGTLGGGVATVRWLLAHGAQVTVTDLRTRELLKDSVKAIGLRGRKIRFVFGRHEKEDFVSHDGVVVNPAVRIRGNAFLARAKKKGIPIINDLGIFLNEVKNPVIAVTGTRGKTTTTNWIAHFLSGKYTGVKASGNSSRDALLELLPRIEKKKKIPAILELSSFQLECAENTKRTPDIAIITNLFRDHLNRHGSMREYARAKANIFKYQTSRQILILNKDNAWTAYFLKTRPKSRIYFISKEGQNMRNGLSVSSRGVFFFERGKKKMVFSPSIVDTIHRRGDHNMYNFLCAALAAYHAGITWKDIATRAENLPAIQYRQEIVFKKNGITVVNDTTATSPEGAIAAINRFGSFQTIFITGGTDKNLEYKEWAKHVKKNIPPENLFFLGGSATKKMIHALNKMRYFEKNRPAIFSDLRGVMRAVEKRMMRRDFFSTVVFSPGAASFEKFKNEFDRGEKFNALVQKIFGEK